MVALSEKNWGGEKDTNSGSELDILYLNWLTRHYFTAVSASKSVSTQTGNQLSVALS